MGTEAPTSIVIPVHCAPKKAPCPKCGKRGRRVRTLTRTVRTVAYKAVASLEISYGEYRARCDCCTTFRNTPAGVLPKGKYDNKVRDLVLGRILEDEFLDACGRKLLWRPSPIDLTRKWITLC